MVDPKLDKGQNYMLWKGEKEWKIGVDPAKVHHEPFNPDLPIKYKIEFEGDKLKKYIEFIDKKIHSGMSVPLSILFGSIRIEGSPVHLSVGEEIIPEAPNPHAIHLEDNEEEVATEDPIRVSWGNEKKGHPMDKHYPHICFECKHDLIWRELVIRNIHWNSGYYKYINKKHIKITSVKNWIDNIKKYRHLKQLWRSSIIQFYCCDCYDDMMEEL